VRDVDRLEDNKPVIDSTYINLIEPPPLLICSFGFLKNLNANISLGKYNNKTITNTTTLILRDKIPNTYSNSSIPAKLSFYKIINETAISASDLTNLSSEVPICETEIESLTTRMTTAEGNITTNTTDITALKNKTLYEGLFAPVYESNKNRAVIMFNYNKGKLLFWPINDSTWSGALNNGEYTLNADVEEITIPGTIKKINQDGTTNKIINKINYMIAGNNTLLSNLKTLTTMPDVYSLAINFTKAPNLRYFNLMDGLEELIFEGTMTSVVPNYPDSSKLINLRIPASVKTCSFKNILFGEVIFEGFTTRESGTELALTLNQCWICDKLYLVREVSSLSISNQSSVVAPRILETSFSLLKYMNNDSLGNRASEGLTFTTLILHRPNISRDEHSSMTNTLTFKRIYNYTYLNNKPYGNYSKLVADSWIE
jgi:hypothetical protein